jgi:SNF2 family DNA or RNA helicase
MNKTTQQVSAIEHLKQWKVGALFMEAGTGKTRVAINLVNSSDCTDVFWFAPLRTIDNVKQEITKWGGFAMNAHYCGVESISASDRIYMEIRDRIAKSERPFIVVDESLKIKNAEAKRTKRLLDIGQMAQYKLILNGTPLSRNLLDVWSQMEFLSPKILKMSLAEFKNTFCRYTKVTKRLGYKHFTKEYITGYENIDYLYSLIRHYVYECDLHLNITQNYNECRYAIGEDEKELYNTLKRIYLDDETLQWKNNNIFLEMTQKMQHAYCCTEGKFKAVEDIFKDVPQENTIIFCKYVASREACEARFPKAKVLSYQKEALGLNLQDYNHTIYFDKIWDLALRVQSGRRTYRTGQEYDCKYYDLTGDVGLESLIDRNIAKKVSMTEYFKGKTKEEINECL